MAQLCPSLAGILGLGLDREDKTKTMEPWMLFTLPAGSVLELVDPVQTHRPIVIIVVVIVVAGARLVPKSAGIA